MRGGTSGSLGESCVFSPNKKTLHREKGFEKPFTERGVLKNPSQEGIHTYMLGGPCLDRPPEAKKIKFRTGSPECFKTIAETKVWTHFLVQAGYLVVWRGFLKRILIENS